MGYQAQTPQAGRMTDSDGGGWDWGECGTIVSKKKRNFYIDYEAFKQ
jgi:hypothetical protein